MPTLWERTVFFATGQLPDAHGMSVSGEAKQLSVAAEIRDHLLGQSLDIMTEWKTALGRASSDDERSELGSFYKNQLGVLNGAFDAIRAADSTIETRIDIDQVAFVVDGQTQRGEGQRGELEDEDYHESADAELLEKLEANHSMALSAEGLSVAEVERLSSELARNDLAQMERQSPGASGAELLAKYEGRMEEELASVDQLFSTPIQPEVASNLLPPDVSRERLILEQFDAGKLTRNQLPSDAHEYPGRIIQAQIKEQEFGSLLAEQAVDIREEWQRDLESGHHNQHALESYFAGKVDQHNRLNEMAVEAHPELQQTLPPPINYIQLRDELQQQIEAIKDQQVSIQPELAAAGYGVSI